MPIFRIVRSDGTEERTDKPTVIDALPVAERTAPSDPVTYTVFDERGLVVLSGQVP